jgi:hypothetical protein
MYTGIQRFPLASRAEAVPLRALLKGVPHWMINEGIFLRTSGFQGLFGKRRIIYNAPMMRRQAVTSL